MSANFLSLPSELRNRVYELCLLHEEPIEPLMRYNQNQLTPELLRANKTIHREAKSLLYGQNRFDFAFATPEDVASFLATIGSNNADYVQHVCVNFPSLCDLESGNVTIEEGSDGVLANIQSGCTNLKTLMTTQASTNTMALKLDEQDDLKMVDEALALVNTRFRAIPSLRDIIVEVHEDAAGDYIRMKMESHGWTVRVIEYVPVWVSSTAFGYLEEDWDFWL